MSAIPAKKTADEEILFIEPFTRTQFPVLISLFGFSGCGKTLSAIKIAKGLGGKTAFLDTETGRGRVYAKDAEGFVYAELTPPFTPERYVSALKQLERAGINNLILDSGSHEWDGLGGMLEIADANTDKFGNKIQGRAKWSVKSRHKSFMNSMMAGRMNIIICLRAKDKFVKKIVGGKEVEVMEGFLPLQERNFKYDMMIQLPMPEGGRGRFIMDETLGFKCPEMLMPAFREGAQITEDVGAKIAEWIRTGDTVDETLRQLRAEAMKEAENGTAHFRMWWKELSPENQKKLKPYSGNFESIAVTADHEIMEEQVGPSAQPQPLEMHGPISESLRITPMDKGSVDALQQAITGHAKSRRPVPESEWWGVLDEVELLLHATKTMNEAIQVMETYARQLSSFDMTAPPALKNYWSATIEGVTARLRGAKAA